MARLEIAALRIVDHEIRRDRRHEAEIELLGRQQIDLNGRVVEIAIRTGPLDRAMSSNVTVRPMTSASNPEMIWIVAARVERVGEPAVRRRIGAVEDAALDLENVAAHGREQLRRRLVDRRRLELELAVQALAVQRPAVDDDEQAELRAFLQLARIVQLAQQDEIARLQRTAARPHPSRLARIGLGMLDLREHDLGAADRAVGIDQVDAQRVLELRHLVDEGDPRVGRGAEREVALVDAVDVRAVERLALGQQRELPARS